MPDNNVFFCYGRHEWRISQSASLWNDHFSLQLLPINYSALRENWNRKLNFSYHTQDNIDLGSWQIFHTLHSGYHSHKSCDMCAFQLGIYTVGNKCCSCQGIPSIPLRSRHVCMPVHVFCSSEHALHWNQIQLRVKIKSWLRECLSTTLVN